MRISIFLILVSSLSACQTNSPPPPSHVAPDAIAQAIDAKDRPEADRALDAGRHPAELLAFFGVAPGNRVGELFASGGYTTELLARTVGPRGVVFAENPTFLPPPAQIAWSARLAEPALANVVRCDRDFGEPFPPEATGLDVVVTILNYHDAVGAGFDRGRMNRSVFAALRSGGVYGIVDHAAREKTGSTESATLHRVDEALVGEEVTAAGFRLVRTADFLRNPADARDWNASGRAAGDRRGTSDRFVLRFEKP